MAFEDIARGAGTGASTGGAIGSFFPGIGTAIGTAAGGLIGGAAGGFLGRDKHKETSMQKHQRQLVDELLSSLRGQGAYADLFNADPSIYEKNVAEPFRRQFRNQTIPAIQQSFIQYGQHRGTGLEDALSRAGVDLESIISQGMQQYQENAQNRRIGGINAILSQAPGMPSKQSGWDAAMQGLSGYLSGDQFGKDIQGIGDAFNNRERSDSINDSYRPPRKGFETDRQVYNPYSGVMQ